MFRFGCALSLPQRQSDFATHIYARCVAAQRVGLGVVRITGTMPQRIPTHTEALLQSYIQAHRLRIVIHASFAQLPQLIPQFHTYAVLFEQLACRDAVIICHVPQLDDTTATLLDTMPAAIRRHLALEHTHQHPEAFVAFADRVELPPIFDWLHYHLQAPWPYQPAQSACMWAQRWGTRQALIHMSSPSERGAYGAHGARIDAPAVAWLLRTLHMHGIIADIELETAAGIVAYQRLMHELARCAPDLHALINQGGADAHTI